MSSGVEGVPRTTAPAVPTVAMPAPTKWPLMLALGIALSVAGMVTSGYITMVGVVLTLLGAHGWFREVLPHEHEELVPVEGETLRIQRSAHGVARVQGRAHQQVEPLHKFSLVPGLLGGIAGGAAMIVPALLYGLLRYHSIWYAVNLLAAGGFPSWADQPASFFAEFHWRGLVAASIIHGITAPLVGLLYAALLPMFPKRPILTAGFIVPLMWTALLYGVLGLVSPVLNERIDWIWFIPSQLVFGLVTGYVVNLFVHVRGSNLADMPLAERVGLHSDVHYRATHDKDGE